MLNQLFTNFFRCNRNRCTIPYIPKHLHQNNKPLIPDFSDGELLFWRLGKNPPITPYSSISLYDVSFNRSGIGSKIISVSEDVLWNIESGATQKKYISDIVTLVVKRIFSSNPPCKSIVHPDDISRGDQRVVVMTLLHDPLPCNYAHCIFVFDLNGVRVSKENYQQIFGGGALKKLRQACRDELSKAILQKEVSI